VDAVTRTLAKELSGRNIRVNSINPGLVDTEGLRSTGYISFLRKITNGITPIQIRQPEDIAPVVVFLASAESKSLTGETIFLAPV
jgi:3-oxoacyl-[acyl-carrier protein] reductase